MRFTVLVLFCYFPLSSSELHSLQYFYIATSGVPHIPEFISVGMVDGVDFSYYDSNIKKSEHRQTWMEQINEEDPDYWGSETYLARKYEQIFRDDIKIIGKRFNHTEGVHILQKTYGCHWDEEARATDGFEQFGYDGEDFLTLDLKNNMRWIAKVPQAAPSKQKWDNTEHFINRQLYFKETCVDWLKKYVQYGSSTLERKVPPEVSVFQNDDSSAVVCHATGFYPDGVMITWKRDGVEMQEDVDVGETLPNGDRTFQKRAALTVSPEERKKSQYTCEVAHKSGETIIKTLILEDGCNPLGIIIGCVVAALVVICVIVAVVMMKKKDYNKAEQSDTDSDTSNPIARK
ncbi:patr class I histocompatibility antigen, B-2 alpha chain-like [Sardina pilchardus]|uniref:patr class I histocompatibility antigen, B-2 alpha chain-like n=1 Tax=Sardina pilchardus TaxID=27697 RepID=UPI002E148967